jgi:hypothetical protein
MIGDYNVTEAWRGKNYEFELTNKFFETSQSLEIATAYPSLENLKTAFSKIKGFMYALIYSEHYLTHLKTQKDVMDNIEAALFGNPQDAKTRAVWIAYDFRITQDRFGEQIIINGQNIARDLGEVFFIIKQFAYKQGFFTIQPKGRILGKDALDASAEM